MPITTAASSTRHYDTLILGAGMSGLSCAARLFQHQHYREKGRLLVLEARARTGGRISSVHVNGCRLDTGANWIHGIGTKDKPNPLMSVLPHKRYKQLSGAVVFQAPREDGAAVSSTAEDAGDGDDWVEVQPVRPPQPSHSGEAGDRVVPTSVAEVLMGSLWSMMGSLHEGATERPEEQAKHITMLQAIAQTDEVRETYREIPAEYHRSLSAFPQFVENMEAGPLAAQSAEHPREQPGLSLLEFGIDDFDGEQVFLQDGYTAVVDEVARDLVDAGLIQLGTEVKHIDWSKNPITIETSQGVEYTARQVICTIPLGVLQHRAQEAASAGATTSSLFQPPLPSDKQAAIESLGFGTLDKIMLVYQDAWWKAEPYTSIFEKGMVRQPLDTDTEPTTTNDSQMNEDDDSGGSPDTFIGFTAELPGIEIHQDGTVSSGLRVLFLTNLHNLTGFPVLSAFVSCANAGGIIETMTDEQAGGVIHRALTEWLGQEPPKPDAVHVTRWAQDEFSRGSYSHMITGLSEARHREAFQKPVVNSEGGILRFAGEHTSRNHFATVHGALLSGWREADAILKSTGGAVRA